VRADADFDAPHYRRFYESKKTREQGAKEVAYLGAALVGLVGWYGGRLRSVLRSVLEVGAGTGLLRDWFASNQSRVRYVSTEYRSSWPSPSRSRGRDPRPRPPWNAA
jgi:hypothetical protein